MMTNVEALQRLYQMMTGQSKQFTTNAEALEEIAKNYSGGSGGGGVYYNANNYGVTTDNDDNSTAMQALMLELSEKGGGIIFIPCGTYQFKQQMTAYSNVSILGESMDDTILKVVRETDDGKALALFYHRHNSTRDELVNNPIKSCFYKNFTIDMSEMVVKVWNTGNKAFFYQNVHDCVFEDLKLIGTPATALGIDCLVNTHMNRIHCENCGWMWNTGDEYGGAGIGIGAGLLDNESFTITNCICRECGHFGIFVENQAIFNSDVYSGETESVFICNNKVIDGRGNGIGVRRSNNVIVDGNSIINSAEDGIYIDQKCKNVIIQNNEIRNSGESGITMRLSTDENDDVGTDIVLEDICIRNNIIDSNLVGFSTEGSPDTTNKTKYLAIKDNIFSKNGKGIEILTTATHDNTLISNNSYFNNTTTQIDIEKSLFTSRTIYNECYMNTQAITYSDLTVGTKLNPDGTEVEQSGAALSTMFPVNSTLLQIYANAPNGCSVAIGQYNLQKEFIERSSFISLGSDDEKYSGTSLNEDTKYIKVFVNNVNENTTFRFTSI